MAATLRARSRHRLERSLASGDERGTDVWLKLPGLESLHAQVVWMRGHLLGCELLLLDRLAKPSTVSRLTGASAIAMSDR